MAEITGTYYAMTDEEYSKIATAIQEKTGKTGQILGSEFATAISEIDSNDPSYAWNSEEVVINTGAIPDYAFYNNTKIKKVTIGAGVTSIGANAFNGCTALAEVDLGQGNLTINSYAFNGCTALKKIVIPENVVKMYKFAFNNCTSLTEIEYNAISADGDDLSTAGDAIFSSGTPIAKITIGNKVKKIPRGMFGERTNARTGATVTEITIPDNVEILEERAFQNLPSLKTIHLGNGLKEIGLYSIGYCTGLTSITIPDSVTSIGESAFDSCTGLTSITIPDSVTSIGESAFQNCTGLTSITIPDSVTSIGINAFADGGYKKIEVNSPTIPQGMFFNCTKVSEVMIGNSVTSIGQSAFDSCTGLTSITIPDSVTSIGGYAFQNCTGLTSITIPDSVTSIGQSAFQNCTGLTSITIMGKPYFNDYCFKNTSKVEQLVMKGTTGVPTLSYTSCFNGSTLYNSSSTAKIYVPSNLLASYQTATNWSDATIKAKLTALQDKITIDGTEYNSVYGQTWQEWCESENNTDGFVVSGNNILTADKTKFVKLIRYAQDGTTVISEAPTLPTDNVITLAYITTAI